MWKRLRGRLPVAIAIGQGAAIVALLIDLATASADAPPLLATITVAIGLGLAGGGVLGAIAAVLSVPWAERPSAATIGALAFAAALWIGAHGGLLVVVPRAFHDPTLMALLLVAAGFVLLAPAALGFVLARRALARIARLAARWRPKRALAAGESASRAIASVWHRLARRRAVVIAGWAVVSAATLALALGPIGDDPRVHRGALVPVTIGVLRPLLDRDGDGALGVLGDGDCAEGDATRGPRVVEILDDGIDQDCHHGDLHARPPLAASPAAAANTVVLLTIGGVPPADLPRLAKRMEEGVIFAHHTNVAGRLARQAGILLSGRLHDADLPVDGQSLPAIASDAGWTVGVASTVDLSRTTAVFPPGRSRWNKDPVTAIGKARRLVTGDRVFFWVHLLVKRKNLAAVDAALDSLLALVAKGGSYRVLVVDVGTDKDAVRGKTKLDGGPVALLGGETGEVAATAGLFDVYPTLLALMGLADPAEVAARLPALGRPLLGALDDGPVLGGWLGPTDVVVAFGPDPDAGAALLRDGLLGPTLRARNLDRAAALVREPDDLNGNAATIAGGLHVLGCARRELDAARLEVTLYLRGGAHLARADRVEVMLKSPGVRLFSVAPPPLPFGTWPADAVVAHRMVFDRRHLGTDAPMLWAAVLHDGKRLKVTRSEGASRNAAPICVVAP